MKVELLKYNKIGVQIVGLHPIGNRSFSFKLFTATVVLNYIALDTSLGCGIIKCGGDIMCISEILSFIAVIFTSQFLYFVSITIEKSFEKLIDTLQELMVEFKSEKYTMEAEKHIRKATIWGTGYSIAALIYFHLIPIFDYKYCAQRGNRNEAYSCTLPSPGIFPFDTSTNPGRLVAYLTLTIWTAMAIYGITHCVMLFSGIVYHVIAHLRMLEDKIKAIGDHKSGRRYKLLEDIVRHHSSVLDLGMEVSKSFNVYLTGTVLTTLIVSLCGFQIVKMFHTTIVYGTLIRQIFVIMGYLITLSIVSILGQLLIDKSSGISDCVYETEWYNESIAFQKLILVIMTRSRKALKLRSASVNNVSFDGFAKIMTNSYSYLMLLYNMVLLEDD